MFTNCEVHRWNPLLILALAVAVIGTLRIDPAHAASASEINSKVNTALRTLYAKQPGAKALADKARGVLVFPDIVKGGFIVAGQFGHGGLRKAGKTVGYYRSLAASVGFQAGAQSYGYVLFFMDNDSPT